MEARVGIERLMLCFPRKFSHQTADSQGYSASTRAYRRLPIHYSPTEEFTEGAEIFRRGEVLPEGRMNEEEVWLIAVGQPEPEP